MAHKQESKALLELDLIPTLQKMSTRKGLSGAEKRILKELSRLAKKYRIESWGDFRYSIAKR